MTDKSFVHLHLHTEYSLLDGACRVEDVIDAAIEQGMPAAAVTDHGVMHGVIPFYEAAVEKGLKPILGCEVYVAPGSRFERKGEGSKVPAHHLVLLAANETGYHNLVHLVSRAHLEGFYYKPRIDRELLAARHEGLIGLSACLKGAIPERLVAGEADAALRAAGEYAEILGRDGFFLELQDHGIPEQQKANRALLDLARRTGIGVVATNDVHYLRQEDARAHEVLLCLQTQTVMSDPKRMRYPGNQFHFRSAAEMGTLFRDVPEALDQTLRIAERCTVELRFDQFHFPMFQVPRGYDLKQYFVEQCRAGLNARYGIADPDRPRTDAEREVVQRFRHELEVIERTAFINYFLVVWDFVRFARSRHIPVGPGRGSGAGSLIAYVLGITGIDPLRYGLIFERFLNPERVSPPDFDIDFCQARRGEVIEYVREKYGRENVAQIITFGSLGAKTVIRDVGRVLEIPYADCDRLAKMVPEDPKITLAEAQERSPDFKTATETNEACRQIMQYAPVLEGLCRNAATHAAGVVIGEKPLIEIVPLTLDKDRQVVTQYAMDPLGKIGLLKMDFLGLRTLTVIQEAVDLVRETQGTDLDVTRLPMDDRPTYDLLKRGDTVGVFQLESSGMRDLVRRVGVDRIEDLIAMIALFRPGPMNMLEPYVDRKSGKATISYDHAKLKPILEETYGVMIYQEQVQQAAHLLAGYSLGQADTLRRAMAKKKPAEMEAQRATFIKGCGEHSRIPRAQAERIFDTLVKFAGYGFNKSHSAAYGIIAYQTAYLKAHHPVEFMAATLSSEMGNMDRLPVLVAEARDMGIEVRPPHVNRSGVRFRPEEGAVRFGLAGIKNVGEGAAAEVVAERERRGPYPGLLEFCARVSGPLVNKKVAESLVRSGALDGLGGHRARLFQGVDFALGRAAAVQRDRQTGQRRLFDFGPETPRETGDEALPDCAAWHESQLLSGEKELLGTYMSGHPLSQYAWLLERYQLTTVEGLRRLADGTLTRLGGLVAAVTPRLTKKQERMAVLQVEDLDGSVEVVMFPEAYREYGNMAVPDRAVLVCGAVRTEDKPRVIAAEVYPLEKAPELFSERVGIHLPAGAVETDMLDTIRSILRAHAGPIPVTICLEFPGGEKVFLDTDKAYNVCPAKELVEAICHVVGEEGVYVAVSQAACRRAARSRRHGPRDEGAEGPAAGEIGS